MLIARLLESYPDEETILNDFTIDYQVNFIPTPQLVAQHTADLEVIEQEKQTRLAQIRVEAEQRAYQDTEERLRALNAISLGCTQ